MTSASACRPRLVGRLRGIMPAPAPASGVLACRSSLQVPRSTTARHALGLIDGCAADAAAAAGACSLPSCPRPARENAPSITHLPSESRDCRRANFPRQLCVVARKAPPLSLSFHFSPSRFWPVRQSPTRHHSFVFRLSRDTRGHVFVRFRIRARRHATWPRERSRTKRRATRDPHFVGATHFISELAVMRRSSRHRSFYAA